MSPLLDKNVLTNRFLDKNVPSVGQECPLHIVTSVTYCRSAHPQIRIIHITTLIMPFIHFLLSRKVRIVLIVQNLLDILDMSNCPNCPNAKKCSRM